MKGNLRVTEREIRTENEFSLMSGVRAACKMEFGAKQMNFQRTYTHMYHANGTCFVRSKSSLRRRTLSKRKIVRKCLEEK